MQKSPLLDGLSTAIFQTAGVSQDELAKLARIANCRLNGSIKNNQSDVNALLDDVNIMQAKKYANSRVT
ncbi:hypothetical protein [Acinetobacter sp. YH12219]|uniref:hypothetical protein n=1 Tax=Acinetobacter sp. YH12219 TaxID=2601153 RepID=UPI0015D2074D|nr:hypothetical protein [Acinetobacter sp. YH12219]